MRQEADSGRFLLQTLANTDTRSGQGWAALGSAKFLRSPWNVSMPKPQTTAARPSQRSVSAPSLVPRC